MQFARHEDASNRSPSKRCNRRCKDFVRFTGMGGILRGLPPPLTFHRHVDGLKIRIPCECQSVDMQMLNFGKRLDVVVAHVESREKSIVTFRTLRRGSVHQISFCAYLPVLLLKLRSEPYTVGTACYLRGQGAPHSSDTIGIPVN